MSSFFNILKQGAKKETGKKIISEAGKKIKGYMEKDPNVRKGIAKGLREHRKSEFHKTYKKIIKKLDKNPDLSYLKGTVLKD